MAAEEPRVICETCRWWDNSTQLANADPDTTGACRVNAPKIDRVTGRATWPFTEDTDWCGNHVDADQSSPF